jgi:uncharacterized membrane protein YeaQ/YmgE (transglycosylase-associated protein family)
MAVIASWLMLGGGIGFIAATLSPARFPAGRAGATAVGAAGAFVGGGAMTLLAGRSSARVDLETLVAAAALAAVVLSALRHAQLAEPRSQ